MVVGFTIPPVHYMFDKITHQHATPFDEQLGLVQSQLGSNPCVGILYLHHCAQQPAQVYVG